MGTYDTRGGTPISPDVEEPYISTLEETVLEALETAEAPTAINDHIIEVIRQWQWFEEDHGRQPTADEISLMLKT